MDDLKKEVPEIQPKTPVKTPLPAGVVKEKVAAGDYNVEVIKDYYGKVDPFYLSQKDPKYAYRFLREDKKNLTTKTSNMLFQKGGWQICQKEHLKRLGIQDEFISPDGVYRVGDTLLSFMPKDLFNEKEKIKHKKANAPMDAVKRLVKEGDTSLAGIGHKDMKGIQPQKKLGM